MSSRFTTISFRNYKAFKRFSLTLGEFNVLVGPNNSGKSTIVGAFRILAEGLRRATSRKAEYIDYPGIKSYAYEVSLDDLPVSTENIFTDYDDSNPAAVEFKLSNGNKLKLYFPESERCFLVPETTGKPIRTPSDFKREFNVSVKFVPVLGPVEHNEPLYQLDAARNALLSHTASRNFRNIWHHYPDGFEDFRSLVQQTWPGMDIGRPELSTTGNKPTLHMFCPEERVPREIYWAGFGFQVWCQMLTFISQARGCSLLVIDEPDIYLHSDLQRQLVYLLRNTGSDIVLATHSTEIISEAEPGELVVINKRRQSATRIKNPDQIQSIFGTLGSNLNPVLTQLAKTRRVVFVEGKDFSVISSMARKLGFNSVANRSGFAVVPAEGFNPSRIKDFTEGMQTTLGSEIARAVIFDRDFRPQSVVERLRKDLTAGATYVHIHDCKELENHLLIPVVLDRAVRARLAERARRGGLSQTFTHDMQSILDQLAEKSKSEVFGQQSSHGVRALREQERGLDEATATTRIHQDFELRWNTLNERLKMVPGKEFLSKLNSFLQEHYSINLTVPSIISAMSPSEISHDMQQLVAGLNTFATAAVT